MILNWINELQVDDMVIIKRGCTRKFYYTEKIDRIAEEFIITTNGKEFSKSNGLLRGATALGFTIIEPTSRNHEKLQRYQDRCRIEEILSRHILKSATTAQLRNIRLTLDGVSEVAEQNNV